MTGEKLISLNRGVMHSLVDDGWQAKRRTK